MLPQKDSLLVLVYLFKYKFIYFNWRLIALQYCIGFAIHQHEFATGVHMFPILNPSPTSLPIPLGYPSAPAPSILYHASNLDWRFISHHMISKWKEVPNKIKGRAIFFIIFELEERKWEKSTCKGTKVFQKVKIQWHN